VRLHGLPPAAIEDEADDQRDDAGDVEDDDDREQVVVDLVRDLSLRDAAVAARVRAARGDRDENEQAGEQQRGERRLERARKISSYLRRRPPAVAR
jgi:hypothetical protein